MSCSGDSDPVEQTVAETKKVEKVKVEKEVVKEEPLDLITNENVRERLLAYGDTNPETKVLIKTSMGDIKIRLYEDTPLHRANFIMLTKAGYFDGCLFTRVVKGFIAQVGGAYEERQHEIMQRIGNYTIPPEFSHRRFHKKGSVGSARSYNNNPDKRSECDKFYFVEGSKYTKNILLSYELQNDYEYTKEQENYYINNPGAAHIDGEHTVFGIITEGYSVVKKITSQPKDGSDWPLNDIYVEEVVVMD